MKVLVFAHRLEVGGTQVNAIELAARLRDRHGIDCSVFAGPGPMEALLADRSLCFHPAPDARFHPSPARMHALRELVRRERPDVIHAWDWWQGLEAYLAVHLPLGVPLVITDMMMDLTRVLPKGVLTTFGTPEVRDKARRGGWRRAELLLPPVDVHANAPGVADRSAFRKDVGAGPSDILVVSVSRLARVMKLDGLIRAIAVVRQLGRTQPLKLVLVGDGQARGMLQSLAREANADLGREAVVLAGEILDPRAAYAAADIVIGMGGSALRGMAFAKPVVIIGEDGFARLFSPETAAEFYHTGMYGHGEGGPDSPELAAALEALAMNGDHRAVLGAFGRAFVVRHHALEEVAANLARLCEDAVARPDRRSRSMRDILHSSFFYCRERRFLVPSRDGTPGVKS